MGKKFMLSSFYNNDKIVFKSNLVTNLLGKEEISLSGISDIDELLFNGEGIDFSNTEIDDIKSDLQHIFESIEKYYVEDLTFINGITFINCPDSIKEYILKNVPIDNIIHFEEGFFDKLKANYVTISKQLQNRWVCDSMISEYDLFRFIKNEKNIYYKPVINISDLDLIKKYGNLLDFKIKVDNIEEYRELLKYELDFSFENECKNQYVPVFDFVGSKYETESGLIINKKILQQIIDDKVQILTKIPIFLEVESMLEITPEQLNCFQKKFNILRICTSYNSDIRYDFYSVDVFEKLQIEIKRILNQVDIFLPDLDRFIKIYEIIGKKIQYNFNSQYNNINHTLEGGLLNNTCVCAGISKILQQSLKCSGIECKYISGINKSKLPHAWNHVKIGGNWYNCDLTFDLDNIKNNKTLEYCLKSDDDFIFHTANSMDIEKCENSYDINIIHSKLDYTLSIKDEKGPELVKKRKPMNTNFGVKK